MPYCKYRIIEEQKREEKRKAAKEKRHTAKWKLTFVLTFTLCLAVVMGLVELNITRFDVHSVLSAGQWFVTGWLAFVMIAFTRNM